MVDILTNSVVCPHCGKSFYHNKVNGIALLEIIQNIEARKRMYCRLSLDALERDLSGELPKNVKKIILDNFNDFARDIHTLLGFGREVE